LWWTSYLINFTVLNLVFEYPFWFLFLCILLGAAGSVFLYYYKRDKDIAPGLLYLLMGLRFSSLTLISFLLLSPMLRQNLETVEKPLVILGVDNSESVSMTGDSVFYRKDFPGKVERLIAGLKKNYDVKIFLIGENVEPYSGLTYKEKQTDLSVFFKEIEDRYSNRNVGAIILATDGIYNKGLDPYYASGKLPYRIYCVPLGDTLQHKDIVLKKVAFNPTVYKGNRFPLEIFYSAHFCQGNQTRLTVSQGNKILFSKEIQPAGDEVSEEVNVLLDTKESGQQIFDIRIALVEGEASSANNHQRIYVQVLNSKQKIAILYNSPHPDIAAIEQALMKSGRYDITASRINSFSGDPGKFDLFIFHQLPSIQSIKKLDTFFKSGISSLFILGTQSDLSAFNNLLTGLVINSSRTSYTEAQPVWNEKFSLFTLSPEVTAVFSAYPPLMSPVGNYQFGPVTDILFYQKVGSVFTQLPLFMFSSQNNYKVGIIAGENIWKWEFAEFSARSNHDVFDELMVKTVQFLSVKDDKSFFRVKVNDRVKENEGIQFDAEVYNASYELVNDPDVNIMITDSINRNYPFLFNKTDKAYQLQAGIFPPGTYRYHAWVDLGNKHYQKSGSIRVIKVNSESINLVADQGLLYRIATSHDGVVVLPGQIEKLSELLDKREDIYSVSTVQKRFTDLIGNPFLFLVLLLLLSAEWVIRKRNGL